MRIAPDTNILVYAEGLDGPEKQTIAKNILRPLDPSEVRVPVQVLGEVFSVLIRKGRLSAAEAQARVMAWKDLYPAIDITPEILADAMQLVVSHQIASWDAVILAAAASAGCHTLLSEDMQDGFAWRGVTVRNPFLAH